jgi:hypothetical protein
MSLTRPERIEEGQERELLKEWDWDHDTRSLDSSAIRGANVLLDQIKSDAQLFLTADDGNAVECTVNLFGEYFLTFDITQELKELADSHLDWKDARKAWECELADRKALADMFKTIAADIEGRCEKARMKGTLDEQYGMGYDEWHEKQGTFKPAPK